MAQRATALEQALAHSTAPHMLMADVQQLQAKLLSLVQQLDRANPA